MSRLAQSVVEEREEYVRGLFRANPELTGIAAQAMLTQKFGHMMRPNRLYDLKNEIVKKMQRINGTPKKATVRSNADTFATANARMRVPDGYQVMMIPVLVKR